MHEIIYERCIFAFYRVVIFKMRIIFELAAQGL